MVASRSTDVAFIVLLAGTGLPGEEILYLQGQAVLKAMGAGEKVFEDSSSRSRSGCSRSSRPRRTRRLLERSCATRPRTSSSRSPRTSARRWATPTRSCEASSRWSSPPGSATSSPTTHGRPWRRSTARSWRSSARKIARSRPGRTSPRSSRRSRTAGNSRIKVKELPGLNHLFQTCKTGARSEYAQIEETIAPGALAVIADWISEQVG